MLYVETNICSFAEIKKLLPDIYPSVKLSHVIIDNVLYTLGFSEVPLCIFTLDMTWDEYEDMMDKLIQLEIDAYNTEDGIEPSKDNPYYQKYLKYGWLWNLFYQANENGKIKEFL